MTLSNSLLVGSDFFRVYSWRVGVPEMNIETCSPGPLDVPPKIVRRLLREWSESVTLNPKRTGPGQHDSDLTPAHCSVLLRLIRQLLYQQETQRHNVMLEQDLSVDLTTTITSTLYPLCAAG